MFKLLKHKLRKISNANNFVSTSPASDSLSSTCTFDQPDQFRRMTVKHPAMHAVHSQHKVSFHQRENHAFHPLTLPRFFGLLPHVHRILLRRGISLASYNVLSGYHQVSVERQTEKKNRKIKP